MARSYYDLDFVHTSAWINNAKDHDIELPIGFDDLDKDGVTTDAERVEWRENTLKQILEKDPNFVDIRERVAIASTLNIGAWIGDELVDARQSDDPQALKDWAEKVDAAILKARQEHAADQESSE
jgi:hypothetical protein